MPKTFKRCLIFLLLLSIVSVCSAQPTVEWEKTFGEGVANSVQQTSDGGFILAGEAVWYEKFEPPTLIEPLPSGEEEPYPADVPCFAIGLIKVDSKENEEWNKILGSGEYDAYSVQQTSDGGFILAGEILLKTDSKGNEEWNKTFEGSTGLLQQTGDGGYTVALWFYGARKYYLIKVDSKGNEEWNKTLSEKMVSSVQHTSDGGYILAGYTNSYDAEGNLITTEGSYVYLIKTDSKGVEEWEKTFRARYTMQSMRFVLAESVQQTTDGGYILAGTTIYADVYLIKLDSKGNEEWNKTLTSFGILGSVQQTSDGGYILAGGRNGYVTLVKIAPEEMPSKQHGFEVITPIPTPMITPTPSLTLTPLLTPVVTPMSVPGAPGEPGFETIFAIAGLLAVSYLLRKLG